MEWVQGLWIRGDRKDYDAWAEAVGDGRWSYRGMLPYFRRSESHFENGGETQHGVDGPVSLSSVTSSGRKYPLREPLKAAWAAVGVQQIPDINCGDPLGLGEVVECRTEGKRVVTSAAYPLVGVQVMTSTMVKRILFDERKTATGVELVDGRVFNAKQEVVLSAGAYRTPQILMLSGVGPSVELERLGIKQVAEAPDVGTNLHEHLGIKQFWKLREPEKGLALGSPLFNDPAYANGNPIDWLAIQDVEPSHLEAAVQKDGQTGQALHPLLKTSRCHIQTQIQYAGVNSTDPVIPMNGSHLTSSVILSLPTSRGSVTLASADPEDPPVINPNYYATEADRSRMRVGLRTLSRVLLSTTSGQAIVSGEVAPEKYAAIGTASTDEEIDARVAQAGQ